MDILVSAVIPVYNGEKYLRECVESVAAQTIQDKMEIILVDDGSTDCSPSLCDELAKEYPLVRVIHKENGGVSTARNAGIDICRGKYIGFIDCDDTVAPQMYERLVSLTEKTGADMGVCIMEQELPDKTSAVYYPFKADTLLDRDYICTVAAPFMLECHDFNSLCNKLFNRSIIEKNSLRLTVGKRQGEDREFVVRYLLCSGGMCYTRFFGYHYRLVENSAVQTPRYDYIDNIFEQYTLDRELFRGFGMDEEQILSIYSRSLADLIICAVSNAYNKFFGRDRRRAVKGILNDPRVVEYMDKNFDVIIASKTGFHNMLVRRMKRRSYFGIVALMSAMRIKVALYSLYIRIKGGARQ